MSNALFTSLVGEFDRLRARFPAGFDSSLTLPCLRRIQEERGYVAEEDIDALTAYLGVPRIQVEEVLSFYTQFRREPVGRFHLEVCRNVSCSMRGAERLIRHLHDKLGVAIGGTTADGRFTLKTCECLGSCGTAPVMVVNDEYHENMSPEKADELLGRLG
ncbi:MAG: NADH-quinone oxidoreductase subunit NuoE [Aquincola sp.]|nr:NADH-quinone oxidoreductase subunit NuoE [Aquincola sp.]MDH4287976.1 NADH-quinone oxidoreductase subunit NuoE [Aquincola sp.]MDH5329535.1 NADH-quinone oxidoreductase subunit NuoE [Aquincola sp.]